MYSFRPDILDSLTSHEISRALAVIHEARGKQELYEQQKPEVLKNLRQVAIIESTESSNRLEGVTAPRDVMNKIIQSGQPLNVSDRSEAEIAGYRKALGQLHDNAANIPLTNGVILQLHRDLMGFTPEGGGYWKKAPNDVTMTMPNGERHIRAHTTSPHLVDMQMRELVNRYSQQMNLGKVDTLLLVALFALDFLCIHPFSDGNGRMARLLTVLLLYSRNYRMVRYISLERIIEQTKESYYETLNQSDRGWHNDGSHDPASWVDYFLSVLVEASNEFTSKVESVSSAYGMKRAFVIAAIDDMIGSFSISELGRKCPTVGRDTLRTTLRNLKEQGCLEVLGFGRKAKWQRLNKPLPKPVVKKEDG